jgi:hypothetical protein
MKLSKRMTRRVTLVAGGLGATSIAAATLATSPTPAQAQGQAAIIGSWYAQATVGEL